MERDCWLTTMAEESQYCGLEDLKQMRYERQAGRANYQHVSWKCCRSARRGAQVTTSIYLPGRYWKASSRLIGVTISRMFYATRRLRQQPWPVFLIYVFPLHQPCGGGRQNRYFNAPESTKRTNGSPFMLDCENKNSPFDWKLVSVKLDAFGFVFPTFNLGF